MTYPFYQAVNYSKGRGFAYHADITAAKKIAGGHTDPGVNFPVADFLKALV